MSVLTFPLYRRRDLIDEVVQELSTHHHEKASTFWREMAKRLMDQLVGLGIHPEGAKEEVRMLLYAALDEMQQVASRASGAQDQRGDGPSC